MKNLKQIKSKKRVRDFAEVFTNEREVKAMCDLVNDCFKDIASTFLEPACGNGNFLVEIFSRKLKLCRNVVDGLKALNSIFGIDIQADNVEESRERLLKMFVEKYPNANTLCLLVAKKILKQNIICADSLAIQEQLANGVAWCDLDPTKKIDLIKTRCVL